MSGSLLLTFRLSPLSVIFDLKHPHCLLVSITHLVSHDYFYLTPSYNGFYNRNISVILMQNFFDLVRKSAVVVKIAW